MKTLIVRYLNEIVGLTVMALMTMALVAGQAEATAHDAVRSDTEFTVEATIINLDEVMESVVFRADIAISVGLHDLIRLDIDGDSIEAIRKVLDVRVERGK